MEYRRLGKSGLQVSALALGAGFKYGDQMSGEDVRQCMIAAREAGVNFFDNAEGYGDFQAEVVVGNVIKGEGWRREDLVISTKGFHGGDGPNDTGLSHKHIVEGVDNSLRRLQLDYVDLVFCHHPEPNTPIEETVRALDLVIKQDKAFYWGTPELPPKVLNEEDQQREQAIFSSKPLGVTAWISWEEAPQPAKDRYCLLAIGLPKPPRTLLATS